VKKRIWISREREKESEIKMENEIESSYFVISLSLSPSSFFSCHMTKSNYLFLLHLSLCSINKAIWSYIICYPACVTVYGCCNIVNVNPTISRRNSIHTFIHTTELHSNYYTLLITYLPTKNLDIFTILWWEDRQKEIKTGRLRFKINKQTNNIIQCFKERIADWTPSVIIN
jgi:hypothetical protein